MEKVDYIIVGAGYAGVFFAHQLIKAKKTFKIFYDGKRSASEISAGVCNPVILKRFNTFWKSKEQVDYLKTIFGEIENYTSKNYLIQENVVRIFHDEAEKIQWSKKSEKDDLKVFLNTEFFHLDYVKNLFDAGKVNLSCRVDVSGFFNDLHSYFKSNGWLIEEPFDHHLIDCENNEYKNLSFNNLVFCEGIANDQNPFFANLPIVPNKGHCLQLKLAQPVDQYTIKKKHFLFHLTKEEYYYGGTYDRFDKDLSINNDSVEELLSGLKEIYAGSFDVLGVSAAFRATVPDRRPIVGRHHKYPNFYILNGLGARGVYNGSFFSKILFDFIEHNVSLEEEVDVNRFDVNSI